MKFGLSSQNEFEKYDAYGKTTGTISDYYLEFQSSLVHSAWAFNSDEAMK